MEVATWHSSREGPRVHDTSFLVLCQPLSGPLDRSRFPRMENAGAFTTRAPLLLEQYRAEGLGRGPTEKRFFVSVFWDCSSGGCELAGGVPGLGPGAFDWMVSVPRQSGAL